MKSEVIHGDCREVMKAMPDNSVDAICCDPPYGLSFMQRNWDHAVPGPDFWAEALRVAKPGAFLLAFGGTRTFHRLMCAIEDAGWELRDTISGENVVLRWKYGSGFPKSLDLSKAVDAEMFNRWLAANPEQAERRKKLLAWAKAKERPQAKRWRKIIERGFNRLAGTEREAVGENPNYRDPDTDHHERWNDASLNPNVTAPATPEAAEAEGIGTALKPSWEPIVVARKPLKGTVAQCFLEHGTGGINVDACRIGAAETLSRNNNARPNDGYGGGDWESGFFGTGDQRGGRWPANTVLCHLPQCEGDRCISDCPVRGLDEQSGELTSGAPSGNREATPSYYVGGTKPVVPLTGFGDSGGASRFFYTAKAPKAEREAGLHGRESRNVNDGRKTDIDNPYQRGDTQRKNIHTTVKPVAIMRWLVRLVARPGQTVLDPFCGSGTTGIACKHEGVDFIGIELEAEHVEIAKKRIAQASIDTGTATVEDADEVGGTVQLGLFGQ